MQQCAARHRIYTTTKYALGGLSYQVQSIQTQASKKPFHAVEYAAMPLVWMQENGDDAGLVSQRVLNLCDQCPPKVSESRDEK